MFELKHNVVAAARCASNRSTSRSLHSEGPVCGLFAPSDDGRSVTRRQAAVGVCDERSCECEQTDCEHDERAVQ